jgi:2-amino-4-hydroxy-6-hydroxymethyldihydropteridine diphosphokinase
MPTAYIALGGNLGDRAGTLLAAVKELNATPGVRVTRLSTFHDTTPVGGPTDQPRFLNAAAELATSLGPVELLAVLLAIEQKFGRVRREKDGPRTLDLDLLLYDGLVRTDTDPIVPHPRMHLRRFVLAPLAEVAAGVVVPGMGTTVKQILSELEPQEDQLNSPPSPGFAGEGSGVRAAVGPAKQPNPPPPPAPLPQSRERGELLGLRTLVTGSTSGIGRAIATAFAAAGADVIVHGRKSTAAAKVAAEIAAAGVCSQLVLADLHDPEAGERLLAEAWSEWNGLDVIVLNAGADTLTGPTADWPFERKLAELLAVDVTSTMLLGRAAGERMRQQGHGVILTIGWDQAETGMAGDSGQLFAAAKGAVMAFTRSLAVSLAPTVRVNCIAPGWIKTAWGESASKAWHDRVKRETPLERWGTPEDVAATAVWLASPAAAFVTGQIIRINGGAVR